jgi:phosphonate transport system substrate-binding protein
MLIKKLNKIIISSLICSAFYVPFKMNAQTYTNDAPKKTYTIGNMKNLFMEVDVNDAQAAIKVWVDELVKTYRYSNRYNLRSKIYNQIDEVNEEKGLDSLAILSLNTYDYLNDKIKIGLDPMLVPSVGGDIFGDYYILVRKDEHYKNLEDLKGTSIGILASTNHIASRFWLDVILAKLNIPDKTKFFKNLITANKESQLILNLFFGQVDACIVSTGTFDLMKELNPQIGEKLISIQTSPKYLWGVTCFTRLFNNQSDRDIFYRHALHMNEQISGKQLFSLIKIDRLVPFKNEYLNSFKDLLKEYNYLLKTKKIKYNEPN